MAKKTSKAQKEQLFEETFVPAEAGSGKLFDVNYEYEKSKPVECLAMTFPNDEARRAYFTEKLREKLCDPEFRKIEGFPLGDDEDILALSDPPHYTACPNPFLGEFILQKQRARNGIHRVGPFASDITEGKSDPIYDAHPYHTKVPPKALMRLLLHYTQPGDVVLDAFSGSGMLGVAASLCESPQSFLSEFQGDAGARFAILSDIAPLAAFIGGVNSRPQIDGRVFLSLGDAIVKTCRQEFGWMYKTRHTKDSSSQDRLGDILYTIWTEFFRCPECNAEFSAWDVLVDRKNECLRKSFLCPGCGATLEKDSLERVVETYYDPVLAETAKRNKSLPVWIHYKVGTSRFEKGFLGEFSGSKCWERGLAFRRKRECVFCSFQSC